MLDTEKMKQALEARRQDLSAKAEEIEGKLRTPGDPDFTEQATAAEGDEVLEGLENSALLEIAKINTALARIENGSFVQCTICDAQTTGNDSARGTVHFLREELAAFVGAVEAADGRAHAYSVSALEEDNVEAVVSDTIRRYGQIDVLINAVGGSTIINNNAAEIEHLSLDEWRKLLDFNLTGTFLFCHHVVPAMKQQRSGKIINLSSISGRGLIASSSSAYAAAKGGIVALTRKLSLELGEFNITVNAIAPNMTLSERIAPRWEKRSDEEKAKLLASVPLGRLPTATEQENVVCFLASDHASYVTGQTIDINGGQR